MQTIAAHIVVSCTLQKEPLTCLAADHALTPAQAVELSDLSVVAAVLGLVPRTLLPATFRAMSVCTYASVLAQAFG